MSSELAFNGINGATGAYLLPKMSIEELSKIAQGETFAQDDLDDLKARYRAATGGAHLGVKEGVDPADLSQTGWGVIFASDDGKQVEAWREALKPLLDLRREQAGERYREYIGGDGFRPNDSKNDFLTRHGIGPGPADPDKVPYYLLIVASPERIPYRFQYQLDVQYAVGRIHFDALEDYANYAASVVRAETGQFTVARKAAFFGVRNPGDIATQLSADDLVGPLGQWMNAGDPDWPGWSAETLLKDDATKARLSGLLHDPNGPSLLFTASHGMGFPKGDPRQLPHQGALLCQDWPGPLQWMGKPIPEDHYLSADDIGDDAALAGMINFHFACYGAGTPKEDDFAHRALQERKDIAPHAFMARLPQRLLSHPRGGALAVVGHVERAWGYSFTWGRAGAQRTVFESTIARLAQGLPVGRAMEYFDERYAELSAGLTQELEDIKFGKKANDQELAGQWTANNDARSYIIIGDPAVRLPLAAAGENAGGERRTEPGAGIDLTASPTSSSNRDDATADFSAVQSATDPSAAGITVTTSTATDVSNPSDKRIAARTHIDPNGDIETVIATDHGDDASLLALHQAIVEKSVPRRSSGPGTARAVTGD